MDMQEKQIFPMRKGEDPSLPWPDCGMQDISTQPQPENSGNMNQGNVSAGPEGGTQLPTDSIDPRLLALAMAFVPRQRWETPYDFDVALKRGTIFPALDKPFLGEEALPR